MDQRRYYSIRTGKHPIKLDLTTLLRLFLAVYNDFTRRGYFQEAFGYYCVDLDKVPGSAGPDENAYILLKLRKDNLWPINEEYEGYTEEDLFDIIELLYDHVSLPVSGREHTYGGCGWHYEVFDKATGQEEFRVEINKLLKDYGDYELANNGEIVNLAIPGTELLVEEKIPEYDKLNVNDKRDVAIQKFRHYSSSIDDRKDAVRMLVDILEFLRPQLRSVLTRKDEADLFNIANNFGIRHHNKRQKTDYDQAIWIDWMFYYYLATINSVIKLIDKAKS